MAVILIDLDHFKAINDRHGHAAGDAVLRGVADVLRRCVRATDIVARFGGEEFLVILPNQTLQEADVCAERCRKAVAAETFDFKGAAIGLTISAGIASRRPDMNQSTDLLAEADDALYLAKRSGRNAVRHARAEQPCAPPAPERATDSAA